MIEVKVIPFEWYHVPAMELREQEQRYFAMVPNFLANLKMQKLAGPCYTAVIEGRGIACSWGFAQLWPGVIECWLITSTIIDEKFGYKRRLVEVGREIMREVESGMKAHRLQMSINPRFLYAIRYAKALNFTQESVLKAYGPDGSDYYMFARTSEKK